MVQFILEYNGEDPNDDAMG